MKLLYTTKEIAEIYGGEKQNVTPYMITHTWIPNGLKKIKGKGNSYLFKKEWVEQYIEEQTQKEEISKNNMIIKKNTRKVTCESLFVH